MYTVMNIPYRKSIELSKQELNINTSFPIKNFMLLGFSLLLLYLITCHSVIIFRLQKTKEVNSE